MIDLSLALNTISILGLNRSPNQNLSVISTYKTYLIN